MWARIAKLTWCRRITALPSPTGRSTKYDDTRLPSSPLCWSARTLTGTIARMVVVAVTASPRVSSQLRSAPDTVASTTSFTVPPWDLRTRL